MNFTFKSINEKLIYYVSIAMILITILASGISFRMDLQKSKAELNLELNRQLALLYDAMIFPLWDLDYSTMESIVNAVMENESIVKIEITDKNREVILSTTKEDLVNDENIRNEYALYHNQEFIGYISLAMTDYYVINALIVEKIVFTFFVFTLVFILIIMIHFILKQELKPLKEIESVAENITRGKLDNTIIHKGNLEIASLQEEILLMQDSLKRKDIKIKKQIVDLEEAIRKTEQSYKETIFALAKSVEVNDYYTGGHCDRVSLYAMKVAEELNLANDEREALQYASILHDIGKIGIPAHILNKPGKLTNEEYEMIKEHVLIGYKIIKEINFLNEASKIILQHHERFDGHGYPYGIKGDRILLTARILSVVDSYDAMTSHRVYRDHPLSQEAAIAELKNGMNRQYDPQVVKAMIKVLYHGEEIEVKHHG